MNAIKNFLIDIMVLGGVFFFITEFYNIGNGIVYYINHNKDCGQYKYIDGIVVRTGMFSHESFIICKEDENYIVRNIK